MSDNPIVIVGIGEIGSVFARGFLRCGQPVHPVTRGMDMSKVATLLPHPHLALIAVGEADLSQVLTAIPESWREKLVLIQNELLPRDWQQHGLSPTVASVWFEKKHGQDVKIVVPTVVYGHFASDLCDALQAIDLPVTELESFTQLQFELVRKNIYILVSNICGLKVGGTVTELWNDHNDFAMSIAGEVLDIQQTLVEAPLERERLIAAMVVAFEGDPDHRCMGRSAPARLARAIAAADEAGLEVPLLRGLQA